MHIKLRTLWTACMATCLGYATTATGSSSSFPSKPIRLIVPYAVGGTVDTVARQYGDLLGRALKQVVIIENKPGASTNIANKLVATADPDGYTLLFGTGLMTQAVTFGPFPAVDPIESFEPVSLILTSPQMIAANTKQPFLDPKSFLTAAKASPGKISIASAQLHLYVNLLQSKSGAKLLHVPYKGGSPAVMDTIGGRTDMIMAQPPVLMPLISRGDLKPIAVLSKERLAALPNVKTFAEAGLPSVEIVSWYGTFVPKGTPTQVIDRLSKATQTALSDPAWARIENEGVVIQSSTPEQLAQRVKNDVQFWKSVARDYPDLKATDAN